VISNTWLYDPASDPLQSSTVPIVDPSGTLTNTAITQSYDMAGELTSMTDTLDYSSTHVVQVYTNTYDLKGNRTQQLQTINGGPFSGTYTTTLRYDQANRLSSYTGSFTGVETQYQYNGDGLRMGKGSDTIQQSPPMTYTWDVLGIGSGGLPLLAQEQIGFEGGYKVADYEYGLGSTPLIEGDYSHNYPYIGDAGNAIGDARRNNQLSGGKSDQPLSGDVANYLLPDGLGNVRIVYGVSGGTNDVLSAFDYGAYGGRSCLLENDIRIQCQVLPRFGYTGQYQDDESGLVYLRARYYDPASQQFLSRDPAVESTRQPYGYARGNPTNVVDPSGLEGVGPFTQISPDFVGGAFDLLGKAGAGMNAAGAEGNFAAASGTLQLNSGNASSINGHAPQEYPHSVAPSQGRGPRGDAGQQALEELYGPGISETFQTAIRTKKGFGRKPDLVVREGAFIYAHESCVAAGEVKLGSHKRGQALKDAWLMENLPGYSPMWHFWDGPPARPLANLLRQLNIPYIVYRP
jgi:RHS repeat-associated protein